MVEVRENDCQPGVDEVSVGRGCRDWTRVEREKTRRKKQSVAL